MDAANKKEDVDSLSLIDALGVHLHTLANEQVVAREPIERRWLDDIRQYQGKYTIEQSQKLNESPSEKNDESGVFINATRHKTNTGEAVIGDLLFPNDQKNWGIDPTPVPEISEDIDNTDPIEVEGQQMQDEEGGVVTKGTVAKRAIEIAREKADKMEKEIEDQFVECDYNAQAREAIHWSAMIGTGIIKGPIVHHATRKQWQEGQDGVWKPGVVEDRTAAAKHCNPFHIYPDMTASRPDEMEFLFEVTYPLKHQVQALANDPAIKQEQLIKALVQGPQKHLTATQYQDELRAISGLTTVTGQQDKRYELWQYRGPIDFNTLVDVGAFGDKKPEEDALTQYYGVVWMLGNVVIKVKLNPEGFEPFPYYFYPWERDHSNIFGYGIPYLMRMSQNVINVAWRQMLTNSSNTAGPQIVIDKGLVEPENGQWEIAPFKVWNKKRSTKLSVQDAFAVFSFNNHQNEIAAIYQLAQQIADEESGVPKLVEGQQGKQQTLGEATLQQNNANNVTRRRVREWDDEITKPLLTQFYDWNMRYNPDNSIKGDFKVKATGSSTLLAREMNQQNLLALMNQIVPHPTYAPYMKVKKHLDRLYQSYHLNPDELIRTDEEVRSRQTQQQEQGGSEIEMAKLQIEQAKLQLKQQELQLSMQKQASQEKVEIMKLALSEKISMTQMQAKLQEVEMREKAGLHKFNTEIKLKLQEGEGI